MADDRSISATIAIHAPPAAVWQALITPSLIKQWFFGVDTDSEWVEGSPIVHRGEYQGRPYEDRGTILLIDPERMLVHTHWSPESGLPDRPENHQVVTWALAQVDGSTELTVSEVNVPSAEAEAVSLKAWDAALSSLRRLLET